MAKDINTVHSACLSDVFDQATHLWEKDKTAFCRTVQERAHTEEEEQEEEQTPCASAADVQQAVDQARMRGP